MPHDRKVLRERRRHTGRKRPLRRSVHRSRCDRRPLRYHAEPQPVPSHRGTSSVVVDRRRGRAKPRTHLREAGVEYLAAYAASTSSYSRSPLVRFARTLITRWPTCMAPFGSSAKAACHPVALAFHGRTNTRPRTTTTHTPVKRCASPARTPMIPLSATTVRSGAENDCREGMVRTPFRMGARRRSARRSTGLECRVAAGTP